ncbi:hypothetical protein EYZ11_003136 [Aspergillus tanneri]|uniref:Uncharacterized protein n=1 Tax=Aspergillus tanneri TaxID=1220188 RepID=A0A4S3JNX9_9EURO|nr:hypothetical protein EYZ11_003136 [Aspergillus tanneri]
MVGEFLCEQPIQVSRVLESEQLLLTPLSIQTALLGAAWITIGGKRRTASMFQDLASKAGLKASRVYKGQTSETAVLELVLL